MRSKLTVADISFGYFDDFADPGISAPYIIYVVVCLKISAKCRFFKIFLKNSLHLFLFMIYYLRLKNSFNDRYRDAGKVFIGFPCAF